MIIPVEVPSMGESVKQVILLKWHKQDGDMVAVDDALCEMETDKANADVLSKAAGKLGKLKPQGQTANVGEVIAQIDTDGVGAGPSAPSSASTNQASAATPPAGPSAAPAKSSPPPAGGAAVALEDYSPAVRRLIQENNLDPKSIPATGPNGRLTKEDVEAHLARDAKTSEPKPQEVPRRPALVDEEPAKERPDSDARSAPPRSTTPTMDKKKDVATVSPSSAPPQAGAGIMYDAAGIHRAPMSKIRKRIAQTLVQAQHTAAILTTFNEVDLTAIIELRAKYKERFQEVHGIGLGFMSFFARAAVLALKEFPRVNAFLEGDDVVYHQFVHLGIAVSTDRGLAVPVLRNVERMSFARVESEIKRVATAVRDGKLSLDELSGGTFTITNGGIFGSLLSTPILNPPQSGILGMHAIQKRPVVVSDRIEIRSMMYLALSYDHRLVDGRESVSFLVRLKQYLEDPARLMLEI